MCVGTIRTRLQHISQLTQLVKSIIQALIQGIQIILDAATSVCGSIGHIVQMFGGIFTEFLQCRLIAFRVIRHSNSDVSATNVIAAPVTVPDVISADGNVMTVAVILVIICLVVQFIIQDLQVIADTIQFLIVNVPQIRCSST